MIKGKILAAFLFVMLIILTTDTGAQVPVRYKFIEVNSGYSNDLYTVLGNQYISGEDGILLQSPNGGLNWVQLSQISNNNIYALFYSYQTGGPKLTAAGENGVIYSSTNSGVNWTQQTSPVMTDLYAGSWTMNNTPMMVYQYIVGKNGNLIMKNSTNGIVWNNWQVMNTGTLNDLKSITFLGKYGWICGNNGTILKTVNYGVNWVLVNTGYSSNNFNSVSFIDSLKGWIVGTNGLILKTTNGGNNWSQTPSETTADLLSITNYYISGKNGTVLYSTNNGSTFLKKQLTSLDLNSVSNILGMQSAVVVGNTGKIFKNIVDSSFLRIQFDANNISTLFINKGIFNQNNLVTNTPAFEWPKGSNKHLVFSTGLTTAAMVNGTLRMAACSYTGEYYPGYISSVNGNPSPVTDDRFHFYKVNRTDGPYTNTDWAEWGYMTGFGAPFVDVNHNGLYEPLIDTPGVKNASQTIYACLNDGNIFSHNAGEGFGGGTLPLYAEKHITAWTYNIGGLDDVQMIKFEIYNKGNYPWNNTYFGLYADSDVGDANDDQVGCDTNLKLGYAYNYDNNDAIYGLNPPAVGFLLLEGAKLNSADNSLDLGMTSVSRTWCNGCGLYSLCMMDPNGEPNGAYWFFKGYKKDGTPWVIPNTTPPQITKYVYSGDPITNEGWTPSKGLVLNCGGSLTGQLFYENPTSMALDARLLMNTGSENLTVYPGGKQTIVISQLVARGNSNLNSVTLLKNLAQTVRNVYDQQNPSFSITGTVKYSDNAQNVTSGYVKALKLDRNTGNIITLDSAGIQSNGTYNLSDVPQDSVYIGVYPNSTVTPDFVPGYYPSTINWQDAVRLYPTGNLTNINIGVNRVTNFTSNYSVNGRVFRLGDGGLKNAILYAKSGNNYVKFAETNYQGIYQLTSVPAGIMRIIVHRIGFRSDSLEYNVYSNHDSVNFSLIQMYVGIKKIEEIIPERYELSQNYPNPFNPISNIKFQIPLCHSCEGRNPQVIIKVFDLLGREVRTLVNEYLQSGTYSIRFDATGLSSGVYFYRMQAGDFVETKRMVLVR